MYFASRMQAGRMLASQISAKYAGQDCVVVALSDGGVVVGSQIALALHAPLCMILSDEIQLPREITALAGITENGSFSYNHAYSDGEIDEMVSEYRGSIEQQKLEKLHHLHRASGGGDLIRDDILAERNIILVSDGLSSGFALDLAVQALKRVAIKSLIMAAPFASIQAVDRMHVLADNIFCLNVLEDFISVDHYYDTQDVPNHDLVLKTVARIVADWRAPAKTNPTNAEGSARDVPVAAPVCEVGDSTRMELVEVKVPEIEPDLSKPSKMNKLMSKPKLLLSKIRPPKIGLPTRRKFTASSHAAGSDPRV